MQVEAKELTCILEDVIVNNTVADMNTRVTIELCDLHRRGRKRREEDVLLL